MTLHRAPGSSRARRNLIVKFVPLTAGMNNRRVT